VTRGRNRQVTESLPNHKILGDRVLQSIDYSHLLSRQQPQMMQSVGGPTYESATGKPS
jgi:hypothetical protein